jgi:hypothetical protein
MAEIHDVVVKGKGKQATAYCLISGCGWVRGSRRWCNAWARQHRKKMQ